MVGRLPAILFLLGFPAQAPEVERLKPLLRDALWADDPLVRSAAERALADRPGALSREEFAALEAFVRGGRPAPEARAEEARYLTVRAREGRALRVLVSLPESYPAARPCPLLIVLGGGPLPTKEQARQECLAVADLWRGLLKRKGWILATVEDTVSLRLDRPELRYLTLRPEDVRAARDAVVARYAVDPARIHLAGISLGANYALQFAAANPDLYAGIVAVVSEGESREAVVRNLAPVGLYALNGGQDRNVRSTEGPRRMGEIARKLGIRAELVEEAERSHEGFADRYETALGFLDPLRLDPWPRRVTRVPHDGLFPVSRRIFWIEADSDQALLQAEAKGQAIEVIVARARRLKLRLHDALVDLDRPFSVTVNGKKVFEGRPERRLAALVESGAAAGIELDVPLDAPARAVAARWTASLVPTIEPAPLPWWEHYARATLRELRPRPDWRAEPLPDAELEALRLPEGRTALRVTKLDPDSPEGRAGLKVGDVLLGVDDEVFYVGGPGLAFVDDRLLRLPELPPSYVLLTPVGSVRVLTK